MSSAAYMSGIEEQLLRDGYALVPDVLTDEGCAALLAALVQEQRQGEAGSEMKRRDAVYALRNLLDSAAVRELAQSAAIRALVEPILGPGCFAVRGILFDKTPDANWKVIWHQDLSIAVTEKREHPGFGPWSEKAGVVHVQPPVAVLERMLTVRLHLDACGANNGPLRVLAGSHVAGRFDATQIQQRRVEGTEVACLSPRGGALLMRPLILHASSQATEPAHRRVIHLEWAVEELPTGLQWQNRVGVE
jgi:ectoine hydroxylase-related dioxygenase (phytanoyl-CoA dioxygenase family)